MGTADDLDILDNMAAAPLTDAFPEQDQPLRNVPEDSLRNLDSLQLQFEEVSDDANKALLLANEAVAIQSSGQMDILRAEQIAKDLPEIMGSPENPVSYTTVPTSVGVNTAVEILEGASVSSRAAAVKKTVTLIDRALTQAGTQLSKSESDWVSALSTYGLARSDAQAAGMLPQYNYSLYIGDMPAPFVLGEGATPNMFQSFTTGTPLAAFLEAINSLLTRTCTFESMYFCEQPIVQLGAVVYSLSQLGHPQSSASPAGEGLRTAAIGDWLELPATTLGDRVAAITKSAQLICDQLRGISEHLATSDGQDAPASQVLDSVQSAIRLASILAQVTKALAGASLVAQAGADFYRSFVAGGNAGASQDVGKVPAVEVYQRPKSRLFGA